jgi:hypothetical protein
MPLSITGKTAVSAKAATAALSAGMTMSGVATPCSRASAAMERLSDRRAGRPAGCRGNRNRSARASA